MWTFTFWQAVIERAIKTLAQASVALLIGDGVGILDIDWWHVLSVAALAAVISILTSIASGSVTGGDVSLIQAEYLVPKEQSDSSTVPNADDSEEVI